MRATCLIAQLALVQVLQQELVRVRQRVLELAPVLVPQPVQVQELQLVQLLVRHLPHQQLQSRFQP